MECPICFENIGDKNCVVTECGHSFHTSCLMQNVSVNGFSCPCCREIMKQKDADGGEEEEEGEEGEEEEEYEEYEESEEDYALRGMRMFHRIINGEIPYLDDLQDEPNLWGPQPPTEKIAEILSEKGFTLEDFVKTMLDEFDEDEYEIDREVTKQLRERLNQTIWNIIHNCRALPEFHHSTLFLMDDL